jgi:hypothetical protein
VGVEPLELSERKRNSGNVDGKSIAKHRNDVLRLYQMIDPTTRIAAPERVKQDLARFLDELDPGLDLSGYGLKGVKAAEVISVLKEVFAIDDGEREITA